MCAYVRVQSVDLVLLVHVWCVRMCVCAVCCIGACMVQARLSTQVEAFYLPPPSNSGLLPRGRRRQSGEGGDTQDTEFKTSNSGVCASVSDPLDVAISVTRFQVTKLRMTRF